MKGKLYLGVMLLCMFSVIVVACTKLAEDTKALEDTKWMLESYGDEGNLQDVLEGTEITATFESAERQVRGSAGCNSYFGKYEVRGNQLTISQIAYTEMACLEPEGVMEQESKYLEILQNASSYEIENGQLRISAGSQVLIFGVEQ